MEIGSFEGWTRETGSVCWRDDGEKGRMNGWVDGRMDVWMEGWMHRQASWMDHSSELRQSNRPVKTSNNNNYYYNYDYNKIINNTD